MLIVGAQDHGDNIEIEPKTRAEAGAHVLESCRQTGTDELGEVLVFVVFEGRDDVVGDDVLAHAQGIVEYNVLDGEINEVGSVVDGEGHDGSVVIGEDGRDSTVEGL